MSMRHALAVLPMSLAAGLVLAQPEPLLDYRDTAFLTGSAYYSQAERRQVAKAVKTGPEALVRALGDDFAILGDADGAFSAPGRTERIYLVQKRAPLAIQPFPDGPPPALVALHAGEPVAVYALPADVQYQRLVAAADSNGDGRDEVLLEASSMNMGQMIVALDAIRLGQPGEATVAQTLPEVYADACDNPKGAKTRRAATITVQAQGFVAEAHELGCSHGRR